ncbi:penicillin acylase family protein [Hyalangium sp.]|uniref:penicillin acylase family protein n=1 Tax=Hyalangium sp. TaxID=2028555 RepID=UPI002D67CA2A|nr:penicillin acylase family protein [Hyalangium sp.]HYH98128.1 penicillin acylase family protein [Hyalangium sp.]
MSPPGSRPRRRWLVLAASLLLAPTSPAELLAPSRAEEAQRELPGLVEAAQVRRDTYGIAHITANHRHDLFFLQGWVHAQDRLFQMNVTRRQAGERRREAESVTRFVPGGRAYPPLEE